MPWVGLQCVLVVFPDHTCLFFELYKNKLSQKCWSKLALYNVVILNKSCLSKEQFRLASELRVRLAPLNWFKPSSKIFY